MGDKSKIEWTDATWNPVTGCTKVSEGCRNCYAERLHNRFGHTDRDGNRHNQDGSPWEPFTKVVLHHDRLDKPYHWRKPRAVFVCSMSDLFQPGVPLEFIAAVFTTMAQARQHTFIVLTKRPDRMFTVIAGWQACGLTLREGHGAVLPNVVLGVSVENQKSADERIPHLIHVPAARRVVSYEPALGPVDFRGYLTRPTWSEPNDNGLCQYEIVGRNDLISGIICGGESGPGARPMHPRWAETVRDQCAEAGVAFFFKQWGEWESSVRDGTSVELSDLASNEAVAFGNGETNHILYRRIGKKAAGRILDGRTHDDLPWIVGNKEVGRG